MTKTTDVELIKFEEAMEELNAIKDPITNQLVNNAVFILLKRFQSGSKIASEHSTFDLKLFVDVMKESFSNHEFLSRVLAGEDFRWLDDEEKTLDSVRVTQPTISRIYKKKRGFGGASGIHMPIIEESSSDVKDLSVFAEKVRLLEKRIRQPLTYNQLREIAQEAAKSYHILSASLMAKGTTDKKELIELSRKFSQIQDEAIMKFYEGDIEKS